MWGEDQEGPPLQWVEYRAVHKPELMRVYKHTNSFIPDSLKHNINSWHNCFGNLIFNCFFHCFLKRQNWEQNIRPVYTYPVVLKAAASNKYIHLKIQIKQWFTEVNRQRLWRQVSRSAWKTPQISGNSAGDINNPHNTERNMVKKYYAIGTSARIWNEALRVQASNRSNWTGSGFLGSRTFCKLVMKESI